jgi:hypothetical protein
MSARSAKDSKLVLGGPPRVDLLPPEVKASKGAAAIRRRLLVGVVAVVILSVAGYSVVTFGAVSASNRLSEAQEETTSLLAAQNEFVAVRDLQGRVTSIDAARLAASVGEIDFYSYANAFFSIMPKGSSLSLGFEASTSTLTIAQPTLPIEGPRIATVTLKLTTKNLNQAAQYLSDVETFTGFEDGEADSTKLSDGTYETTLTIHLNTDALRNRFRTDVPGVVGIEQVLGGVPVLPESETTDESTDDSTEDTED